MGRAADVGQKLVFLEIARGESSVIVVAYCDDIGALAGLRGRRPARSGRGGYESARARLGGARALGRRHLGERVGEAALLAGLRAALLAVARGGLIIAALLAAVAAGVACGAGRLVAALLSAIAARRRLGRAAMGLRRLPPVLGIFGVVGRVAVLIGAGRGGRLAAAGLAAVRGGAAEELHDIGIDLAARARAAVIGNVGGGRVAALNEHLTTLGQVLLHGLGGPAEAVDAIPFGLLHLLALAVHHLRIDVIGREPERRDARAARRLAGFRVCPEIPY